MTLKYDIKYYLVALGLRVAGHAKLADRLTSSWRVICLSWNL
jgi:hypothetical protein